MNIMLNQQKSEERKRCIIFPIDGANTAEDVISIAKKFVSYQDLQPYVAMIKLNDALHFPRKGPEILRELRNILPEGVGLFIDLKIGDVSATVVNTLKHYAQYVPEIVTVSSIVTAEGLLKVREMLPNTKIALVDTLTDMSDQECAIRYDMVLPGEKIVYALEGFDAVYEHMLSGRLCPIDIVVSSVLDIGSIQERFHDRYEHLCPGIRDDWMLAQGNHDHQQRVSGIYAALTSGVKYIVMGSQFTNGNPKAGITADESRRLSILELERYFSETVS